MIRITGGRLRGRGVTSPPRTKNIRPTTALIRESVFSTLQTRMAGCRFLDLFAGSGIMGAEAISRGAAFVLDVEQDVRQVQVIRSSYAALGIPQSQGKIVCADALSLTSKPCREEAFDILFMDPPYGLESLPVLVETLNSNGWLKLGGIMIVEHGSREAPLDRFTRKDYGDTAVSIRVFKPG